MTISVTHTKVSSVPDGADTDLIRPSDWNAGHTLSGVGTMAEQDASNVAITGGSVNGTSLGATTAASAKVTTLDIGSGLTLATSAGTAGQVLTSAGAGNVPTWSTNGAGDVVGPASSTDNAVARFDSTTGKLIQNSTVTINDNGTLEAVNGIAFDTTPTSAPTAEGSLSWNSSEGTLDLVMRGGNVVQQIGEEQYYTVRNETGSTIANGTPVMANGVTAGSGRITVTPAIANGSIDELRFIGLTTESIASGINGYVTSFGYVRGLDTRGTPYGETWAEGDIIYVSSSTAGYLTNVEPTAPNLKIVVAIVITRNQTSGVLFVRPTAYPHITHLSDVNIVSPTSGNLLIYDAPQNRWENADLTASTGISVTNGAGSVTITNTAPDQVVAITGAGGAVVTGTYPNFTVTAPSGTVTSVSGTAPIASSGGATPAISISQATTSTDGYLSSTDWNTFNGKAPLASPTFTGTVTLPANTITNGFNEITTVTASAPSSTTNFDVISQSIQYYTSDTANNWTLNVRGNSGTSLNTLMSTGQTITITFLATNGSTAYYNNAVTIDGNSVTPKWQGGTAPTSGNTSAVDIYTYAIVKTGSATFTVFASITKFA